MPTSSLDRRGVGATAAGVGQTWGKLAALSWKESSNSLLVSACVLSHSCPSIIRDQHRCSISVQKAGVNAHKWRLIIVPWMLLTSTSKTPPPSHTPIQERHVRHDMARSPSSPPSLSQSMFRGIASSSSACNSNLHSPWPSSTPSKIEPHLHFSRVSCCEMHTVPCCNHLSATCLYFPPHARRSCELWTSLVILRQLTSAPADSATCGRGIPDRNFGHCLFCHPNRHFLLRLCLLRVG